MTDVYDVLLPVSCMRNFTNTELLQFMVKQKQSFDAITTKTTLKRTTPARPKQQNTIFPFVNIVSQIENRMAVAYRNVIQQ